MAENNSPRMEYEFEIIKNLRSFISGFKNRMLKYCNLLFYLIILSVLATVGMLSKSPAPANPSKSSPFESLLKINASSPNLC